jgi:uncharacterized protein YndB with AHSA1/START domain
MISLEPMPILSGGRTIEKELKIGAAPERVFAALTDSAELERWFVTAARSDPTPGGALWLFWEGEGDVEGRYLIVEPPKRIVYEWYDKIGTTRVSLDLSPEGDGTRLRLVEVGFGDGDDWDAFYDGLNSGWSRLLDALKTWVETGNETRRRQPEHG